MTDWFLSHTTDSSSFNPQLVLSLDQPPASESWFVLGAVGTVEKVLGTDKTLTFAF
jgi:hypothetical protein